VLGAEEIAFARRAVETGNVDFDVTGQFAAETVQINLDANDPMAEADFHLAYGLYDEAILLLRQASGRDPNRAELRVKLAETYFAAGRPVEFQETAEGLQGRVDPATWQKIAIMGQQLCPDAQIFKGGDVSAMATDLDLAFDEPSMPTVASVPAPSEALPKQDGNHLEFKLEELELPKVEAPAKADIPGMKREDALEFDLGDFDLGKPEPAVSKPAAPKPAAPAASADHSLEFDLGGFDVPKLPAAAPPPRAKAAEHNLSMDELKLEDFDIGGDSDTISAGDETSTKLDLARAYVDMGDNEMARNLLTEVLLQGSDSQKVEAQTLLGRLN
ncbi:MAG: FimV/HubP family polar landmark protein, partial [Solimonas sp.]